MISDDRYCLFTNDVETTSIWHNSLRDQTGYKVYKEGMPLLLDFYEKHNIRTTFFFTGYIAKLIPDVVRMVQSYGHEVASHGLDHNPQNAFDNLSLDEQIHHLNESKKILEDISGDKVITFRAPAARVQKNTAIALNETGFKIDSSLSSQRFDFFLTFGNVNKLKWLTIPRTPYFTEPNDLFRKGGGKIFEIPISALIFPYIGTTLRMFPNFIKIVKIIMNFENKLNQKPIVFLTHPNEFIDESSEEVMLNRRSQNLISHVFGDIIRRQLKLKNLGPSALPIYDNHVRYFLEKGYQFITLKDYYNKMKDL